MDLVFIIDAEEGNRASELEIIFDLIIVLAKHLDHELVERVIIAIPHLQRIPGITPLHLPLQTHLFCLFAEGFLFCLILHLEQQTLLLKRQYGRNLLMTHDRLQRYDIFVKNSRKGRDFPK